MEKIIGFQEGKMLEMVLFGKPPRSSALREAFRSSSDSRGYMDYNHAVELIRTFAEQDPTNPTADLAPFIFWLPNSENLGKRCVLFEYKIK